MTTMTVASARYLGLPATITVESSDGPAPQHPPLHLYATADDLVVDRVGGPGVRLPARRLRVRAATDAPAGAVVTGPDGLAAAIRMGPVPVALTHHAVIAYGQQAGLLTVEPDGPEAVVTCELDLPGRFAVDAEVAPQPDAPGADGAQRVLYGWYLGMPLVHNVTVPDYYGGTAPATPDPALPPMRTYLTAPVDDRAPSSPVRQVPTGDGLRTLPSHQNTTDAHPGARPHNAFGYFVVRGPKGSEETVRTGPAVPDSLPADPLAGSVRIGDRWMPLNNHLVIEYGVAAGLLELVPLEYGGFMTTAFPDRTQLDVACAPTDVVDVDPMARTTVGTMSIRDHDIKLTGDRPNSPIATGARRIAVSCDRLAFTPAEIRVRVGEDVGIELTATDVMHTLVIDEVDAHVRADAGETAIGGFRADRPGTYEFYCSLMAHRAAGMTGRLVVEP
ncbi:cupredoxin domain-containing protein [Micromonospora marina]|uniref:cupredoxin domain-containing protein n=1 Tax=Micromonospora marina TaxID=307120 RepID=UPI003454C883